MEKIKTSPNIRVDSPLYQVRSFQVTLRSVKGCGRNGEAHADNMPNDQLKKIPGLFWSIKTMLCNILMRSTV